MNRKITISLDHKTFECLEWSAENCKMDVAAYAAERLKQALNPLSGCPPTARAESVSGSSLKEEID